jgi:hypothetical protein
VWLTRAWQAQGQMEGLLWELEPERLLELECPQQLVSQGRA